MNLSDGDKLTVLLHLLDRQTSEMQRRETREQQIFEWVSSLLLMAGCVILTIWLIR